MAPPSTVAEAQKAWPSAQASPNDPSLLAMKAPTISEKGQTTPESPSVSWRRKIKGSVSHWRAKLLPVLRVLSEPE